MYTAGIPLVEFTRFMSWDEMTASKVKSKRRIVGWLDGSGAPAARAQVPLRVICVRLDYRLSPPLSVPKAAFGELPSRDPVAVAPARQQFPLKTDQGKL